MARPNIKTAVSLTMEDIINIVSEVSGIPINELTSKKRLPHLVCARGICYHFIREKVWIYHGNKLDLPVKNLSRTYKKIKIPYQKIAMYFNRNHTTLITARVTLQNMLITKDESYTTLFEAVQNKISEKLLTV